MHCEHCALPTQHGHNEPNDAHRRQHRVDREHRLRSGGDGDDDGITKRFVPTTTTSTTPPPVVATEGAFSVRVVCRFELVEYNILNAFAICLN